MFQGLAVVFQYWDNHWWAWWASRGSWAATAPTPAPPTFLSDHSTPDFCNKTGEISQAEMRSIWGTFSDVFFNFFLPGYREV